MPDITRSPRADYDTTTAQRAHQTADLVAAADIPFAGVPLTYIEDTTGQGYSRLAARPAATGEAIHGWSARKALKGEPVVGYGPGVRFNQVTSGLTPGQLLYRGTAPGALSTDVSGTAIAWAASPTDIVTGGVQ